MKKILVITATLGDRETLQQTVDSVREIGGDSVKHVIVTPQNRIEALKCKYPTLEFLAELEGRKGIYAALNHGFRTYGKEYEYMTFINDDDYWLPEYETLIDTITNDRSLEFVYGKVLYVNEYTNNSYPQASSSQFYNFLPLFQKGIVLLTQQSTIIKSSVYFKLGGFDETFKLVADSKFWIDLSSTKPAFKYVDKVCAAYTLQAGQLSSDGKLQSMEHDRLHDIYGDCGLFTKTYQTLLYRLANTCTYIKRYIYTRNWRAYVK